MANDTPQPMDPSALPVDGAARLLTKAGRRQVTEAMLRRDINAGAPTNPDGTLSLVAYAAWLVQQMLEATDGD
jgi:hypothetical protein